METVTPELAAAADAFAAHLLAVLHNTPDTDTNIEDMIKSSLRVWQTEHADQFMQLMLEAERQIKRGDFTLNIRMWDDPITTYDGLSKIVTTQLKPFNLIGCDYSWRWVAREVLRSATCYSELLPIIETGV